MLYIFLNRRMLFTELFFCKKVPLSQHISPVCYEQVIMDERVRDVCILHQSDWIYGKQLIKFLVFVTGVCNMIFLLVSNGNLTLSRASGCN